MAYVTHTLRYQRMWVETRDCELCLLRKKRDRTVQYPDFHSHQMPNNHHNRIHIVKFTTS